MKPRKLASDDRGGPSGQPRQHDLRTPDGAQANQFPCQYCPRSFTTLTGRGVHTRRAHPNSHDAAHVRVEIKGRWSEEEVARLALSEAKLTVATTPPKFINQALVELHPERTLEAIKGQRRNAEYKTRVRNLTEQLRREKAAAAASSESESESDGDGGALVPELPAAPRDPGGVDFLQYLGNLPPPTCLTSYNAMRLLAVVEAADGWGRERTWRELSDYVSSIFPARLREGPQRMRVTTRQPQLSSRKRRRMKYAITQKNWKKHQGRCIKSIIDGDVISDMPDREIMEPFWRQIFEGNCDRVPAFRPAPRAGLEQIWSPISTDEITRCRLRLATSPGPDNISSRELRAIPADILVRIFNLILWCERVPEKQRAASTVFIPKKAVASEPGDYRPITITSVLTRQLHAILARRMQAHFKLDNRQRAFQPTDGCADNAVLFDLLIKDQHKAYRSCHIACLDVGKAFDSVSHETILHLLNSYGFPGGFIRYIRDLYDNSTTYLLGDGWKSEAIKPSVGVKQGDPLSPFLFNLVIDGLLVSLPNHIAARIDDTPVNALAFADDLVLAASTKEGLQELLATTHHYLYSCGLKLNAAKCKTLSIQGQPKQHRTVIVPNRFTVGDTVLPSFLRTDVITYLGIDFDGDGHVKNLPREQLRIQLERLTKAPLKPQQRLHALRTVLIPRLYHKLTLSRIRISYLNRVDVLVRGTIRQWLKLPSDTPVSFFHASVADGGLGVPSLRWLGPLLRHNRLMSVELPNLQNNVSTNYYLAREIDECLRRLEYDGNTLKNKNLIREMWAKRLHNMFDGAGLSMAKYHRQAHRWVQEPTTLLSGRDFINCVRLRIGALPARSRTTRGRPHIDRQCRAGCQAPETINHILQQCPRAHGNRIRRHNAVVSYIERSLKSKGYVTYLEPPIVTSQGLQKPDILAIGDERSLVIDAQVVTDSVGLELAHLNKKEKYNTTNLKEVIAHTFDCSPPKILTCTINWKGVLGKTSTEELLEEKVINIHDLKLISTRVLIGGIICFNGFNKDTRIWRRRPPRGRH